LSASKSLIQALVFALVCRIARPLVFSVLAIQLQNDKMIFQVIGGEGKLHHCIRRHGAGYRFIVLKKHASPLA